MKGKSAGTQQEHDCVRVNKHRQVSTPGCFSLIMREGHANGGSGKYQAYMRYSLLLHPSAPVYYLDSKAGTERYVDGMNVPADT